MSAYSNLLSDIIKEKNISIAEMAQYCDTDRSTLYKIKKGSKEASLSCARKIASYLKLTPAECEEYYTAFYKAVYGEEFFQQQRKLIEFLCNFDNMVHKELYMEKESEIRLLDNFKIHMMNGRDEINYYSKMILEKEAQKERPVINLMTQCDNQFLMNQLLILGKSKKNVNISHIICFDKSRKHMLDNISIIQSILPFYKYNCNYDATCYYDVIDSHFYNMNLFCNVIICSEGILSYTSDFAFGQVIREKESIEIYNKIFQQYKKNTYTFLKRTDAVMEQYNNAKKDFTYKETAKLSYGIAARPCIIPMISRHMMEKKIHKDMPYREQAISIFEHHIYNLRKALDQEKHRVYFSLGGMKDFIEQGNILGVPYDFYQIFTRKEAIEFAKRIIPYIKTGKYRMFKSKMEDISCHLEVFSTCKDCHMIFDAGMNEYIYIDINEPGMIEIFYSFAENLNEDIFLYTPQEAVMLVEKVIESYEREE